jgi:hypothetical protein
VTYVRFAGMVSPSGIFEPQVGWETELIAQPKEAEGPFEIEQLDAHGVVAARTSCWAGRPGCSLIGPAWQDLEAYVPLQDVTRTLRLRERDLVLYEVSIAEKQPRVEVPSVEVEETKLTAVWNAEHDRPLLFNVALLLGRDRAFPLVLESRDKNVTSDLSSFPGHEECRVAVIATDGLRSSHALSEPFALPEQPPVLSVIEPEDGQRFAAQEPISLIGLALDRGGLPLPDEQLVWRLDGDPVAHGQRIVAIEPLAAGSHRLELAYEAREREITESIAIEVMEPSDERRRWLERLSELEAFLNASRQA